ncbi:MAG TPA: hypothetical protein VFI47_02795 [Acidimicrobiales bacterium]|nr:hypothetical protein [Acidimicrobiales bacterium]
MSTPVPAAGPAAGAPAPAAGRQADGDLGGEIRLGSALFTLVEPHRGHEVAYNRWYERDHFYAGCMIGPWYFAGRRWVCTRDLKDLRLGGDEPLFGDDRLGSYLALYWTLKGRFRENTDWSTRQVHWLHDHGRMFAERDHIHTLLYIYRGAHARDADGVPPELALDHPFPGLGAVIVEPAAGARGDGTAGTDAAAPPRPDLAGTAVALVLSFKAVPLPPDAPVSQPGTEGAERRELQLWFADGAPGGPDGWWPAVRAYADQVAASGTGAVRWASPFLPTVPGTDRYTDQLW